MSQLANNLDPHEQLKLQRARQAKLRRLQEDYQYYAPHCLKIRTKTGSVDPFVFNRPQMYAHAKIEEQKARIGKVRAIFLKGRQEGMSTYTDGRFYHLTSTRKGKFTFILSHDAKTTEELFAMVKRFHEHTPTPIKPGLDKDNENHLVFSEIDSGYRVGTAGNETIGRGMTIQYLHCSEAAYYPNADEIMTGLFQAVPDLEGTEIIIESTANGMGNMFHRMCMNALAGIGEYILIFIPWFWLPEYSARIPEGETITLTEKEQGLKHNYNLTDGQIVWRRNKIATLVNGEWDFMREYPCNIMEAFVGSGKTFFPAEMLVEARTTQIAPTLEPVIIGVDCSRHGDRISWTARQGRRVIEFKTFDTKDQEVNTYDLVNIITEPMLRLKAAKVFIDKAYGYGAIDILHANGYRDIVTGINFGGKARNPELFLNPRAQMHFDARDHMMSGPYSIPDDDDFFSDLLIIPPSIQSLGTRKHQIPPKETIKKLHGKSPDITDSFVLTYALPVAQGVADNASPGKHVKVVETRSKLTTMKRVRNITHKSSGDISVRVNN